MHLFQSLISIFESCYDFCFYLCKFYVFNLKNTKCNQLHTGKKQPLNDRVNIIRNIPNDAYRKNISRMKITILYECIGMSIVLLIFMSDIFFLYMSNEGCFTFIIHYFVRFRSKINPYLKREYEKGCQKHGS